MVPQEWLIGLEKLFRPDHVFQWDGEELRLYRSVAYVHGVWAQRDPPERFSVEIREGQVVRPHWMEEGLALYLDVWLVRR